MEQQSKIRFLINLLYIVVIGAIVVITARFLLFGMFPFLLSLGVAALSQTPAAYLSKKTNIKKSILAVTISAFIYIGVGVLIIFLVYRLIISSSGIIDYLPNLASVFGDLSEKLEKWFSNRLPNNYNISLSSILENFSSEITDFITDVVKKIMMSAPSFLLSSVVALVATCYISKDYDGLKKFVLSLCSQSVAEKGRRIKKILIESVLKILRGQLILTLITFLELWLGFVILDIENAYLWAFIIAFVDLLPVLGTGIIVIPWAIFCAVSGSTTLAIGLAILYIVLTIVRNFSEPKIVSKQIGINPLFMLFSMYLGLKLFGGIGILLFPIILIVTVKYYKEDPQ